MACLIKKQIGGAVNKNPTIINPQCKNIINNLEKQYDKYFEEWKKI